MEKNHKVLKFQLIIKERVFKMVPGNLIDVKEYNGEGYKPVVDYDNWRVAVLNYCDELLPENISKMQRHDETDEVFVLLKGECTIFLAEGEAEIENIYAQKLEPYKIYNVKKSVWHNHTLSRDAMVLIVENKDTNNDNSPLKELSKNQREIIIRLA